MPTKIIRKKLYRVFWADPGAHPILISCLLVAGIVALGTYGYMLIEGWDLVEAFYMCIITVSTVGFGEVKTLSTEGRLFTAFLIIAGVGTATYAFSSLIRLIVEGELRRLRGIQKMKKKIRRLEDHHIVCGMGRLGRIVVQELAEAGEPVVAVELDPNDSEEALERWQVPLIIGSAYEDEVLKAAGIDRAKTLLSLLPRDSDNVYVTLCARDLNPELEIVARSEDDSSESRLKRAGANQILAPYRDSGHRLARRLVRPNVSDFLEIAGGASGEKLVIEELIVPEDSSLVSKTLADSDLRGKTGAVIAAFILSDGEMIFNPGAKSVIEAGATLIVLGEKTSVESLSQLL